MSLPYLSLIITALSVAAVVFLALLMWQNAGRIEPTELSADDLPLLDESTTIPMPPRKIETTEPMNSARSQRLADLSAAKTEPMSREFAATEPHYELAGQAQAQATAMSPLLQAQFWLTIKRPENAIEVLELNIEQENSVQAHLLLLNLYIGQQNGVAYEVQRQRMKPRFNVYIPSWNDYLRQHRRTELRNDHDLVNRINQAIYQRQAGQYLHQLLHETRDGHRRGFPLGVYSDIVRIYDAIQKGRNIRHCDQVLRPALHDH